MSHPDRRGNGDGVGPAFGIGCSAAGERGQSQQWAGWRLVAGGMRGTAHRRQELVSGRGDQLDVVVRAEHHQPGSAAVRGLAGRVEAQRGPDSLRDGGGDACQCSYVVSAEVCSVLAASDMDGPPAPPTTDERRAQLERDAGRDEQLAIADAALGMAAGRLSKRGDRHATGRQAGEGVEIFDEVLARDQLGAGGDCRVGRENAFADQLVRCVAGHQPRLRIQGVPARRVAVEHAPQAGGDLGEVLVAGQAPSAEPGHVLNEPIEWPAASGHDEIMPSPSPTVHGISPRPRDRQRRTRPASYLRLSSPQ